MAKRITTRAVDGLLLEKLIREKTRKPTLLAKRAGVGVNTVYKMLRGEATEWELIVKVAMFLEVEPEKLIVDPVPGSARRTIAAESDRIDDGAPQNRAAEPTSAANHYPITFTSNVEAEIFWHLSRVYDLLGMSQQQGESKISAETLVVDIFTKVIPSLHAVRLQSFKSGSTIITLLMSEADIASLIGKYEDGSLKVDATKYINDMFARIDSPQSESDVILLKEAQDAFITLFREIRSIELPSSPDFSIEELRGKTIYQPTRDESSATTANHRHETIPNPLITAQTGGNSNSINQHARKPSKDETWPTSETSLKWINDTANQTEWESFAARYRDRIRSWCLRNGLRELDAEDVAQGILILTRGKIKMYDPQKGRFRDWLKAITYHSCVDYFRNAKTRRFKKLLENVPIREDLERELDEQARAESFRAALEEVRSVVPERDWRIFEEMSFKRRGAEDIAKEAGISKVAVYMAKHRVLHRVKARALELGMAAADMDLHDE